MFVKKTLLQIGNVVFLAKLQGFFPLGSGLWGRTCIYLMSEYNSYFQNFHIYIIIFSGSSKLGDSVLSGWLGWGGDTYKFLVTIISSLSLIVVYFPKMSQEESS